MGLSVFPFGSTSVSGVPLLGSLDGSPSTRASGEASIRAGAWFEDASIVAFGFDNRFVGTFAGSISSSLGEAMGINCGATLGG